MSDKNTSTLQSYIDGATGAVQSAIGSLTNNTSQESTGEAKKDKASLENDASHATAKVGNLTASSSGAITKDDPNRTEGSWNQTVGSAKEAVGGLIGSQDLKNAGARQNAEGKGQEAQGQLNDFGSGIANRVTGAVQGGVAGLAGDREAQLKAQEQHDLGKTQQRGAEADIQKQNS
ncbi:probable mismatched base pair and cruciform DNA recognition protein [Phialocephala subalpina]|uniref:Probable mismatched base pair and cruciform DNA recognition protein n=1 Tax=Phialocephala subalpina TaxID=576137 RepID=A0A1L7WJS3_9HELO|nr:probable mismatched base pair and cruciform DNA recognition protein [Phialocephala subalpina]